MKSHRDIISPIEETIFCKGIFDTIEHSITY